MKKDRTIFVFPGQGAQYVGMGRELCKEYQVARYTFEEIDDITSRHISKICFRGPESILNRPVNTSLGTFAHAVAISRVIEVEMGMPLYDIGDAMVGHSLGQYSALHCVGSLTLHDAAKLVSARSLYMSMGRGGVGMIAIIGLNKHQVENLLFLAVGRGFAAISNHNARDQFIISGEDDALDAILAGATAQGARIARRLNIAVPAHCALMAPAAIKMRNRLARVKVVAPRSDWFSNQTADLMSAPADVKQSLIDQMTNGVRWYDIVQKFPAYNIKRSYELGPGATLTRLITRAKVGVRAMHTDSAANVRAVINAIAADMKNNNSR
ncbi:MAG: ACP S-malonyltransferase [Alphaproteobacteria bacterium]|nr:ACP S-malonyltransferase [Alphaproteobacteria bacterium]